MKVICNRGALLEALTITSTVVNPRSPKPVLANVKLSAAGDKLTLAGTDLEVAVRFSDTQVQVEQEGETLVPAENLRNIVRESVDDTLSIELAGNEAVIKGADSVFKIYTQPASEFPLVPDFEGEADIEIAGGALKQLITQTLFAAAKDATRYAFNGVLVVCDGKTLSFISTDGRRLAQAKADVASASIKTADDRQQIVPAKSLQLVDKLVTDPEELVKIQLKDNQAIFSTGDATLTTNLLEGQFPPYRDVIPKDADKKMSCGTGDFLSAVKRAALLTTDESKGVRMEFTKDGLLLTSRNPDRGEARVNFACKFEGEPVTIGFNPAFLVEALRVVNTDEVTFELTSPSRPGLVKAGGDFLYVIMPVNLQ